ncbi:hypothetical protein FKG94_03745 [Exilibacterium tricleocarpae]|uniref:DUF6316 domain-containing protein n=1 Tax=Exilibacterium tricleocarpae TaxID=2591008 RepID=A0A545U595_9GAMM|nr:DUF6316 family protein [Exilibacterium tricleocarpae]TQV84645.1 hypothetical protein FKG94_03745 [Exilibacterium tricleocarpae]
MKIRRGETEMHWYRADRFFSTSDGWFFLTREGENVGPFENRQEAERAVVLYIRYSSNDQLSHDYSVKLAKQGIWALTLFR